MKQHTLPPVRGIRCGLATRVGRMRAIVLAVALLIVLLVAPASAGMLKPNPANGISPATSESGGFKWTVALMPNPALYVTTSPSLLTAAQAAAQPYNKDANQQWKFSYATTFNGTFELKTYKANAVGTLSFPEFEISYTPGDGDPAGNDVRWIQVINTNKPSARGMAYGVAGTGANGIANGMTAYLDNEGRKGTGDKPASGWPPTDPWYGWLQVPAGMGITDSPTANSMKFTDTPIQPLVNGLDWQAQAFLAKDTVTVDGAKMIHDVKLYGGVHWGFGHSAVAVPEPATSVLMLLAWGMFVSRRRCGVVLN